MKALAGTGSLIRLALRRDRIILPAWIAVFVSMVLSSATAVADLYSTSASRVSAVRSLNSVPVLVALYGRVYGTSVGALSLVKVSGIGSAGLAVLAFMLVIRHTRAEEESGRLELIGSTVVGRAAPLTAGLAVGMGACTVIGILSALSLLAAGQPADGAIAFGLAWAATGCAFAAVGALAAQLTSGSRTAAGLAGGFLGLAYLVRAVGDAAGHDDATWFSWLSPLSWGQEVRPFAQERWQVLLLLVVFTLGVAAAAYVLAMGRDLGASLLADRPGPSRASAGLGTPLGLAWRLQRGLLLAWLLSVILTQAIMGSIASQIGGMLNNPAIRQFIEQLGGTRVVTDAYLAMELGVMASMITVFGMQVAMRLRTEEEGLRTELVLSTSTTRRRWLASYSVIALLGAAGLLLLGGLATAVAHAVQIRDSGEVGRVLLGAAVQIPAVWVMIGIVLLIFGFAPRATSATWGVLVAFLLLGEFGDVLHLPRLLMNASPFAHTPRIPGQSFGATPLLIMLAIAGISIALAAIGFQRRDIG